MQTSIRLKGRPTAILWACLLLFFFSGCGGGSDNPVTSNQTSSTTGTANTGVGALSFQFTRNQSVEVPSATNDLVFIFLDSEGVEVKRVTQPYAASITVEDVPVTTVSVRIVAQDSAGFNLATITKTVTVTENQTTTVELSQTDITVVTFDSITVSPSQLTLAVGKSQTLAVNAVFSDGTMAAPNSGVSFSSADSSIASVSGAGVVTGAVAGTTTITVSATQNGVTRTGQVGVTVTDGITTGSLTFNFVKAQVATLPVATTTLEFTLRDNQNAPVSVDIRAFASTIVIDNVPQTVSSVDIKAVDSAGRPIAVLSQNFTVVAGQNTVVDLSNATSTAVTLISIKATPSELSLAEGTTQAVTVSAVFSEGSTVSTSDVSYTVANPSVASISAAGVITGLAPGTTLITVAANNGGTVITDSINVTVTGSSNSSTGTLTFNFSLGQVTDVPATTASFKFTFRDAQGTAVLTDARPFASTIVIDNVPQTITSVEVEALDADSQLLATLTSNVSVIAGQNVVVDLSSATLTEGIQAKWDIPVLVVRYMPTQDGVNIDSSVASNVSGTLKQIREKTERITDEAMRALENGSRFRYYKNAQAGNSLNYHVVETIEYLEPVPVSATKTFGRKAVFDYPAIMNRIDIQTYVEQKGIKEVWLWGYDPEEVWLWESNFSSTEGDFSNSDRDPTDLPILNKSYTVYHYSYQVDTPEAVHDHGHQIEALLRNYGGVLWSTFEGTQGNWRCGNVHFPINGEFDYDYSNQTVVQSDIEDWMPEGFGQLKSLNSDAWGSTHLGWLVYWMQSIPGDNNGLTYQSQTLTDWWSFIGDFDGVISQGAKVVE